jgi:ATP-dependent DNA helicase Rep
VEEHGPERAALAEAAKDDNERITAVIMARYEERLTAYQSVDFDDLIRLPLKPAARLPRSAQPSGRTRWATCWSTNTRTPTPPSTRCSNTWWASAACFTAVGDDDQSIYGWRGATLDNLRSCRWTTRS